MTPVGAWNRHSSTQFHEVHASPAGDPSLRLLCSLTRCSLPFFSKAVPHQSPAPDPDIDIDVVAQNLLSSCRATLFLFLPCIHQRPSASSDRSNASIIVVVVAAITLALHFPDFCPLRKREPTRATSLAAPLSETRDNPFFPGTSPSLSSPTTT
ncbi:hypothetical protein CDV36_009162 [Fusarium kuroshium]|uniref:Uncharacterized protein n=1 Tax=Fusarium kuroshium TaxID=2010991 RepID=A0A3M2S0X8_9HYPO|nr:hypothetical protein CDV36_009162 [Fusarium kuroshium]